MIRFTEECVVDRNRFPMASVSRGGRRRWQAEVIVKEWRLEPARYSDILRTWIEVKGNIPEHVGDAWTRRGAQRKADKALIRKLKERPHVDAR